MHLNNRSFHILEGGKRGRHGGSDRDREKTRYRENEEVMEGWREALVSKRQREQVILFKSFSNTRNENSVMNGFRFKNTISRTTTQGQRHAELKYLTY